MIRGIDGYYHLLYKTVNKMNGHFYIGIHSTRILEDGYLGSGKRLKIEIKKYGKENFNREILEFFSDKKSLKDRKKEKIFKDLLNDKLCLNSFYVKTQQHKDNIRHSLLGKKSSLEKRNKISKTLSNGQHHRALLWTIQDPYGIIYITKDISNLCEKHNLPYSTFRLKHQQKYTAPIWQGRAKGWAVLKTEAVSKSHLQPFEIVDLI